MKAKLLIPCLIFTILAGCSKDKYTTKPIITFKSVNTNTLDVGGLLEITLDYTDKEGDINNQLYVEKKTRNCGASDFSQMYPLPTDIPSYKKGEVIVTFAYSPNAGYPVIKSPQCGSATNLINDSCIFRFVLTDKANNVSDTIQTPEIVVIKH